MNNKIATLAFLLALFFTGICHAQNSASEINIPLVDDASVFAEFKDKYPLVVNYFSNHSKEEIVRFYQQHYGEILNQDERRGRLELSFLNNEHRIRVIISQQNKARQIDIIIEK